MTQAAILPRRDRPRPRLLRVAYSVHQEDCLDFMQIQPETSENEQDPPGFSSRDKVILTLLKMFDSLLSLYLVGLLLYVIQLTWEQLGGPGPGGGAQVNNETGSEDVTDVSWLQSNITVLGLSRWTMTFSHFSLIFSLIHAVYGFISAVCDIAFFHTMLTNKIKERYITTILPFHRLFFLVISSFDGLLFLFSHHIVSLLGDVFPVLLVTFIGVIVMADTAVILMSYGATSARSSLVFSRPWRHLVILGTIVTMMVYTLVVQYPTYSWDIIPVLAFSLTSILILLKCLVDKKPTGESGAGTDNILNFLMCVSSCNVLGLFSVGTVSHRLMFNYYKPILDFL